MRTSSFRTGVVVVLIILTLSIVVILLLYRSILVSFPDGDILVNGSFEQGSFVPPPNGDGFMSLPANDTTMPSWTVLANASVGQDVAWVSNANRFVPNGATEGKFFVDLTGGRDIHLPNGSFGAVTQTTRAGKPYQLSFDIMVGPPSFPGPITVQASITNSTQDPPYAQTTCGPFNGESGNKRTCTLSFRARGASTSLILQGTQGAKYIGLDNVSVQCVGASGRKGFCS